MEEVNNKELIAWLERLEDELANEKETTDFLHDELEEARVLLKDMTEEIDELTSENRELRTLVQKLQIGEGIMEVDSGHSEPEEDERYSEEFIKSLDFDDVEQSVLLNIDIRKIQDQVNINGRHVNPLDLVIKKKLGQNQYTKNSEKFVPHQDSKGGIGFFKMIGVQVDGVVVQPFNVNYIYWNQETTKHHARRDVTFHVVVQCPVCSYYNIRADHLMTHLKFHYQVHINCLFCRYGAVIKSDLTIHGEACQPFYSMAHHSTLSDWIEIGKISCVDVQKISREIIQSGRHIDTDQSPLELVGSLDLYKKHLPLFFMPSNPDFELLFQKFVASSTRRIVDEISTDEDKTDVPELKVYVAYLLVKEMDEDEILDLTDVTFYGNSLYAGVTVLPDARRNTQMNSVYHVNKANNVGVELEKAKQAGMSIYRVKVVNNIIAPSLADTKLAKNVTNGSYLGDYEAILKCAIEMCSPDETWNKQVIARKESESAKWPFECLIFSAKYLFESQRQYIIDQLLDEENRYF